MALIVGGFVVLVCLAWGIGIGVAEIFSSTRENADLAMTRGASRWVGARDVVLRATRGVTEAGGGAVTIPLAVAAALLWLRRMRRWDLAVFLVLSIAGSTLAKTLVKELVERPRPPVERLAQATGSSFPSGHTVRAVALYGTLAIAATALSRSPRLVIIVWPSAACLAAIVAASRVALGVHYVSDVVGGLFLGGLWLAVVAAAVKLKRETRG